MTEAEKDEYIAEFQRVENITLEKDKIERNEVMRFIAKLMLNSIW